MSREQLIENAPLLLAAYTLAGTMLFFAYAKRPSITPATFRNAHYLWLFFTLALGVVFSLWFVFVTLRSGDVRSRMVSLIFLGVLCPSYGGLGFVAWGWPAAWQRFIGSRDASATWVRQQERVGQRRLGERLRRFMGGPPPV